MARMGTWLFALAVLLALLIGGLFTTAAWLLQSRGDLPEPVVELIGTPVPRPPATPTPRRAEPSPTVPANAGDATPSPSLAASVDDGRRTFVQLCNSCHPDGGKGAGPSLRGPEFGSKYADDEDLKRVITQGTGTMPAFRQLSSKQVLDLIAYIRSLN